MSTTENRELAGLNYALLAEQVIETGGFTSDLNGSQPIAGYSVATNPDAEQRTQLGTNGISSSAIADLIYRYVIEHGHELREGYALGGWLDGSVFVLDLVTVHPNRDEAEYLGRVFEQDAIYDLATRETITL